MLNQLQKKNFWNLQAKQELKTIFGHKVEVGNISHWSKIGFF